MNGYDRAHPGSFLSVLVAGLLCGVLVVVFVVSYAALIFSGPLSGMLLTGIGVLLTGSIVLTGIVAWTGSYPGMIAMPQDKPAAIFAYIAAALAAGLAGVATQETLQATVLVGMALTTLLTGLLSVALGVFRLGNLMRYIPFPVIGGFFAGSGWLLVDGAFVVMTGSGLRWDGLGALAEPQALFRWMPPFLFAALLIVALRLVKNAMTFPILLLAGMAGFYIALAAAGMPVSRAVEEGWMLGPFPEGSLWQVPNPRLLVQADWGAVWTQLPGMGTLAVVSILSLLLFTSGVELAVGKDLDINRELKSTGAANVAASLTGGLAGFNSVMLTVLGYRLGANSRAIGLIAASVFLVVMALGATVLTWFPKPLLAAVLFFVGFDFLLEWLYDARKRLTLADYGVVLLILGVVATVGFLEGIGVGILAGVVLFIVNYSRINVAKYELTGSALRSNVERSEPQERFLRENGDRILILRLQGFIFFGTANRLLTRIQERVATSRVPIRHVVLDFRDVIGLDSSAVLTFGKLRQLAVAEDVVLVFTGIKGELQDRFEQCSFSLDSSEHQRVFEDVDRGLEWCEERLLESAETATGETFEAMVSRMLPGSSPESILAFMTRHCFEPGEALIRQGDPADDMFFVESGVVTIELKLEAGNTLRLKTVGPGTIVGEVAMYLGGRRTASVVAVEETTAWMLSRDSLKRMEKESPLLAAAFHRMIVSVLCHRLTDTNRIVQELIR